MPYKNQYNRLKFSEDINALTELSFYTKSNIPEMKREKAINFFVQSVSEWFNTYSGQTYIEKHGENFKISDMGNFSNSSKKKKMNTNESFSLSNFLKDKGIIYYEVLTSENILELQDIIGRDNVFNEDIWKKPIEIYEVNDAFQSRGILLTRESEELISKKINELRVENSLSEKTEQSIQNKSFSDISESAFQEVFQKIKDSKILTFKSYDIDIDIDGKNITINIITEPIKNKKLWLDLNKINIQFLLEDNINSFEEISFKKLRVSHPISENEKQINMAKKSIVTIDELKNTIKSHVSHSISKNGIKEIIKTL